MVAELSRVCAKYYRRAQLIFSSDKNLAPNAHEQTCIQCNQKLQIYNWIEGETIRCCPDTGLIYDLDHYNSEISSSLFNNNNANNPCPSSLQDCYLSNYKEWANHPSNQHLICDGIKNCPLGEDEVGCNFCEDDEFLCDTNLNSGNSGNAGQGNCLKEEYICDGNKNCLDGSDEYGCSYKYGKCPFNMFTCGNRAFNSDICLPLEKICDGYKDCPDGMDEVNCRSFASNSNKNKMKFTCIDGKEVDHDIICSVDPSGKTEPVCSDGGDLKSCFAWYYWTEWADTCALICQKRRTRDCRSTFTGMKVDGNFCPEDTSTHESLPGPDSASIDIYSTDYQDSCNKNLQNNKLACFPEQFIEPAAQCRECNKIPIHDHGGVEYHINCCNGEIKEISDDGEIDTGRSFGVNPFSIADPEQCLASQEVILKGLEKFVCCGKCQTTRNPQHCVGFFLNYFCMKPWILAMICLILLCLFLTGLCYWKKWLCFKITIKGNKHYPVEEHNIGAQDNPAYITDTVGANSPAIKRANRMNIRMDSLNRGPAPTITRQSIAVNLSSNSRVNSRNSSPSRASYGRPGANAGFGSAPASPREVRQSQGTSSIPQVRKTRIDYVPRKFQNYP